MKKAILKTENKYQLCWCCSNARGGCSWSKKFEPVEGWKATPTVVCMQSENKKRGIKAIYADSYDIEECPEFELLQEIKDNFGRRYYDDKEVKIAVEKYRRIDAYRKGKVMKVKLDKNAKMPTRAHDTDAGLDLYSPIDAVVPPLGSKCIDTGVHIELPKDTSGFLKSKSGLNVKYGITSEGVIDVGYTGSIVVKLYNHTLRRYKVKKGDKISQLVILPIMIPFIEQVDELEKTERGNGGFGSTGR